MREFREGDRCSVCGYWYWESDGGWHSLVPITYADCPEMASAVRCPTHSRPEGTP